jgi:DNA invertase Pin-like site-specific DNA recombinase
VLDFAGLMADAQVNAWALVALDVNVDTTTPTGELMASMMALFSQWERRIISQRTRDALAAKKAEGVRIGRPTTLSVEVVERIRAERAAGQTLTAIADALSVDEVPTAHGGVRWHASTVRAVLARATEP